MAKRPPFAPMTKPGRGEEPKPDPASSTGLDRPPAASASKVRATDGRVTTTLRIDPKMLADLKVVAARRGVKVNDLLLDGAAHVLGLNKQHLTG